MNIKKIGLIFMAFDILACADPVIYTGTTISPYELRHVKPLKAPKVKHITATTVSPLENVLERPFLTADQPETVTEPPTQQTKLKERIFIDENGNKVDYDKNLYFCTNCCEEKGNGNKINKKLIFSIIKMKTVELSDNDDDDEESQYADVYDMEEINEEDL